MGKARLSVGVVKRPLSTDHVSPQVRARIMRAVKSKGARSTERKLRAAMVAHGVRGWRLNADELPGKPDIVFPTKRVAIFVDGCFWHGCPTCYRRPNSNQAYWDQKVAKNIKRDRRKRAELRQLGWKTLRFWEHDFEVTSAIVINKIRTKIR